MTSQYLICEIENILFAVDAKRIDKIIPLGHYHEVPLARRHYEGVVMLDEEVIPLFNLRTALGFKNSKPGKMHFVLIEAVGGNHIGFITGCIREVIKLDPESLLPSPEPFEMVEKKAHLDGKDIFLLEAERFISGDVA